MLKKILLGVAIGLVALCGVIATRPATFSLQRTTTIKAPPDIAFALVNDFHHWGEWSPWDKLDPSQKTTFEGPATGTGARYGWSGNDDVGAGQMTIEESKANEFVRIKLEFLRPFESTNLTTFTFSPTTEGVSVTWKMEGHNNFMSKAFSLVMDMDKMVGKDFDNGLAAMRQVAEAEAQKRAQAAQDAAAAQPAPPSGEAIADPTP